jgi:hypothetical protein
MQMILISFNSQTLSLQVKIKDLDPITISSPTTSLGKDLEIWDMFIGSSIDILGKPTILKQADMKTIEWIEQKAKQFLQTRENLVEEIRKYNSKHFPSRLLISYTTDIPGAFNLKGILLQIQEFKEILYKYRPSLVRQILGDCFPN